MREYRITVTIMDDGEAQDMPDTRIEVGDTVEFATIALHSYIGRVVSITGERKD